ncbi:30S ribosomal protein S4 [Candidatus Pacearchaeota archaeon CG10_big_fil_rev_8_21_14_0_10_31_9]|nr:MAG: 30S ribosomal protein S4 [Candidatus Pacearchaeota archaeon CG1_02_32_21]PIN93495.1 MAG: 30S ribosomal protein S4 [Candidatus Pacearchaeota archaeon CG10_big_fil_rev_8_21_14_0_10_31_9]PIZ83316.1 MAG: 30S ribosomal protein S4 [Candidatus Pacearchaeota archaeon CG_4_10_14_0_2_um_filter_05_32_18]
MIRKHKLFSRPRKAFDSQRIKDENAIVAKYGLKNKEEIWRAKEKLKIVRDAAKRVIHSSEEEKSEFITKLNNMGYNVKNPVEVLSLTEEDILRRRLQTVVLKKGLATTPNGSRQLITHKKISIGKQIVNIPSYHVNVTEENNINILKSAKKGTQKALVSAESGEMEAGE